MDLSAEERFILADIPGLIEGASDGAGLGVKFLGHVERTAVLIHLVDATGEDPVGAYRIIRKEIEAYGAGLEHKTEIVALSKVDALTPELRAAVAKAFKRATGVKPMLVSGVSGEGVTELLRAAAREIYAGRVSAAGEAATDAEVAPWRP